MRENCLPLVGRHTTTYTELQVFRVREYARRAPALIRQFEEGLERYTQASTRREAFEALFQLDQIALELSCLESTWLALSDAVFEVFVMPGRHAPGWVKYYLGGLFKAALEATDVRGSQCDPDGDTNGSSPVLHGRSLAQGDPGGVGERALDGFVWRPANSPTARRGSGRSKRDPGSCERSQARGDTGSPE